ATCRHEVVAKEPREPLFVEGAVSPSETVFERLPEIPVELVLIIRRNVHEDEVTDEVRGSQRNTRRVQALENVVRVLCFESRAHEFESLARRIEDLSQQVRRFGCPARELFLEVREGVGHSSRDR